MFNLSFELKMTVQKQNYKNSVSVQQIEDQTVSRNLAGLLKGHTTSKSNTGVCVRIAFVLPHCTHHPHQTQSLDALSTRSILCSFLLFKQTKIFKTGQLIQEQ